MRSGELASPPTSARATPISKAQFPAILIGVFNAQNDAHTSYRSGLLPEEEWRREWGVLRFYLRSNGGQRVWEIARDLGALSSSFVEFAEKELLDRNR